MGSVAVGGPRIGLVLGGGGAVGRGFHHGVLAAIEDVTGFEAGRAGLIVGTSSGATTAGLLRAGLSGRDLAAHACGECRSPLLAGVADQQPAPGRPPARTPARRSVPPVALGLPASPRGVWAAVRQPRACRAGTLAAALLPAGPVACAAGGAMDRLFPHGWPSDPLWISSVRVDDGCRVMFGRDGDPVTDLSTAVAASCALPGWFAPVVVDDGRYIDGAVWSATNADVLVDQGLDAIIIIAPLSGPATWFHRLQRRYLRREVAVLGGTGAAVLVVEPTLADLAAMGPDVMDRDRRDAVTRQVRERTRARLQRGDLARVVSVLTPG